MSAVSLNKKQILQSALFLGIGIVLFWWVYRDMDLEKFYTSLDELNYTWIIVSILLNLLSQLFIALRWKMLITPMNYNPRLVNLYLAVLILSFTNIVIPRGGEIARGGVVSKYDNIPFSKLLGTVVVERITDLTALLILFGVLLTWQYDRIVALLDSSAFDIDFQYVSSKYLTGIVIASVVLLLVFIAYRLGFFKKFKRKILKLKQEFTEGIKAILGVKHTGRYIFYTFLIYFLWLAMLYVVFFAYEPTRNLGFGAAAFTFGLSTFAFLLPIQAGIGAWHFVVIQCLLLLGIPEEAGMVFALVAHSFTNLIFLIIGAIAFALFPLLNSNKTASGTISQ